jgi:ADP-heptose:LPS heptosyltransferase
VLMQHLGVNHFDQSYIVPFDAEAEARTDAWWPKRPVIIFNPIGRGHARQLSLAKAVAVVENILKITSADVLVLTDPSQRTFAQALKQQISQNERVFLTLPDPSVQTVGDLFANIRRCQAMVSVDTATVHIATGLNKPVYAFYNPQQNDQDFSFVNWSPRSACSATQLAKRLDPQVVDAIDLKEFQHSFSKFVEEFCFDLKV